MKRKNGESKKFDIFLSRSHSWWVPGHLEEFLDFIKSNLKLKEEAQLCLRTPLDL